MSLGSSSELSILRLLSAVMVSFLLPAESFIVCLLIEACEASEVFLEVGCAGFLLCKERRTESFHCDFSQKSTCLL
jgi:hypothetical protein